MRGAGSHGDKGDNPCGYTKRTLEEGIPGFGLSSVSGVWTSGAGGTSRLQCPARGWNQTGLQEGAHSACKLGSHLLRGKRVRSVRLGKKI